MRFEQVQAFLYALKPQGIRFGLENTRLTLNLLGNPQQHFKAVHVAGTNGKGSTCAFLDAILREASLKVGLYTSPHLVHFRERMVINGEPVSDQAITEVFIEFLEKGLGQDLKEVIAWIEKEEMIRKMESESWYEKRGGASRFCNLTFFECTTILAMMLFARAKVELALMEVGMGGRLDATNVLIPLVSVIAPISLEHTEWLGDTLSAIAAEKAGIIKPGIPVVCSRQEPEALKVIEEQARSVGAPLFRLGVDFDGWGQWSEANFRVGERKFGPVKLGLVGSHQVTNAATALGCLPALESSGIPLGNELVLRGLQGTRWPGRFERFGLSGEWILDGAHNPGGIRVLIQAVTEVLGNQRLRLVFGVLKEKRVEQMLPQLEPIAEQVHLVRPKDARGREPASLSKFLRTSPKIHPSVCSALEFLRRQTGSPILITGSLTVVAEARAWLLENGFSPWS